MKNTKQAVPTVDKKWDLRDRIYTLTGDLSPLTFTVKSRNIFWFDPEKQIQRELRYTSNQQTVFVDEFKGDARLAHITFEDGVLKVPKENVVLQKFLSLYHPQNGVDFIEFNPVQEATNEVEDIELEIEALNTAKNMDIDQVEAILRVELGSSVSTMSTKELKRDVLLMAKDNPKLFLELAKDDNVELRNFGIKAVEAGILELSEDNRTFTMGKSKRKMMEVPFDEHPYSALAAYFKTDEGLEIYKQIKKRLK